MGGISGKITGGFSRGILGGIFSEIPGSALRQINEAIYRDMFGGISRRIPVRNHIEFLEKILQIVLLVFHQHFSRVIFQGNYWGNFQIISWSNV